MKNLFDNIPADLPSEQFNTLVENRNVHIERIVSTGQSSPQQGWYDQDRDEWVIVLKGRARLVFADGREVSLNSGDFMEIPAHVRHRVQWTDPDQETVWLAVHYRT